VVIHHEALVVVEGSMDEQGRDLQFGFELYKVDDFVAQGSMEKCRDLGECRDLEEWARMASAESMDRCKVIQLDWVMIYFPHRDYRYSYYTAAQGRKVLGFGLVGRETVMCSHKMAH